MTVDLQSHYVCCCDGVTSGELEGIGQLSHVNIYIDVAELVECGLC